jgi:hypothetical protein
MADMSWVDRVGGQQQKDPRDMSWVERIGGLVKEQMGRMWEEGKAEAKQQLAHGAHELASALNTGQAFVLYPRTNHEHGKEGHGVHGQQEQQGPEMEQRQIERGGRGR